MVSQDIINRIIDEVNIVEVISTYQQVFPDGTGFKAVCPFHNDTNPSMKISPTKKIFKCFSCGAGGNVIQYVQKKEKISFQDAAIKLAKRIGIEIQTTEDPDYEEKKKLYQILDESNNFYRFYLENSDEGKVAIEYLAKRGITKEMIEHFEIGLAPTAKDYLHQALNQKEFGLIEQIESGMIRKANDNSAIDTFHGRIMFPLHDIQNHVVGFSGRIYLPGDTSPKYMNSNENLVFHKSDVLYNYARAEKSVRKDDQIFVFEGFMDVIAAYRAGIENAVATMGTALTKQHVKSLNVLTEHVTLCFDGDFAGINATYKAANAYAGTNVIPYAVCLPDGLDPDEYQIKYGSEALNNYLHGNQINVYDYMYGLAKKDLIKEDVVSVQRFKDKVFDFLKLANNTIRDFYINKLAKELDLDVAVIINDLRTSINKVPQQVEVVVEPKKKKDVVKRKVYRALMLIVLHSIANKDEFKRFFCDYSAQIPVSNFIDYFTIFERIAELYSKQDAISCQDLKNCFIKGSSEDELLDEIMSYKVYDVNNAQEFEDCLKVIDDFIKNIFRDIKHSDALENDDMINDYITLLRQNVIFN